MRKCNMLHEAYLLWHFELRLGNSIWITWLRCASKLGIFLCFVFVQASIIRISNFHPFQKKDLIGGWPELT